MKVWIMNLDSNISMGGCMKGISWAEVENHKTHNILGAFLAISAVLGCQYLPEGWSIIPDCPLCKLSNMSQIINIFVSFEE
jgi:hypothetical protein